MRKTRAAFLSLLLLAAGHRAEAAPAEYVVGVEEMDYLPAYGFDGKEWSGAARTILDRFAADKGVRLVYRPLPIKRLFAELAGGGVDLKFPDNPYWAPAAKKGVEVRYSKPVIRYVDGAMVPPALKGREIRTLGVVAGFTPFAWQERIAAGAVQVRENGNIDNLLQQVMKGRLDGAYISVAAAHHRLDTALQAPGALLFDAGQPHSRDAYMLSSVKHPALVAEFDAWLAANAAWVKAEIAKSGAEKGVE